MKRTAIDYINKESVTCLLKTLVNIPSPYFHEKEIMATVYTWLEEHNLSPQFHHYNEMKITQFQGLNVIGTIKGKKHGPKVYFNGHIDTVNQCNGWDTDPFKAVVKDDKLYGLGALIRSGSYNACP